MTDEPPRLYSKERRQPQNVVAPQHQEIHTELDRFGRWNRERYEAGTCASMEKLYYRGGRDATPPATAAKPTDPLLLALDSVVRHMTMSVPQHGHTLKLYYVKRKDPERICHVMVIRYEDFPKWMFDCRAMVVNLLRRDGVST